MKTSSIIVALATLVYFGSSVGHAALATVDNFASVSTNGTLLSTVSGWSGGAGANSASVSDAFGFGGLKGAEVPNNNEFYALTLGGANVFTAADGPLQLKLNFRGNAVGDNFQQAQILVGQIGGVNSLVLEFNGGTSDASSDNSIKVSSGTGTSWGSTGMGSSVANSAWVTGHWYEVTINFSLSTTGNGQSVTGTVSIFDLTNSSSLVNNISIAGTGTTGGAFSTANVIQLKNNGSSRAFDISDIRIGVAAIPEPAAAAIVSGMFILGLAVVGRRSRCVRG